LHAHATTASRLAAQVTKSDLTHAMIRSTTLA
jgi:hypothetical protein